MTARPAWLARGCQRLLLGMLWLYRRGISPALGPACRFTPTCSDYAREAIVRFGACKGSYLAARRLLRCHPLARPGLDPVPSPAPPVARGRST